MMIRNNKLQKIEIINHRVSKGWMMIRNQNIHFLHSPLEVLNKMPKTQTMMILMIKYQKWLDLDNLQTQSNIVEMKIVADIEYINTIYEKIQNKIRVSFRMKKRKENRNRILNQTLTAGHLLALIMMMTTMKTNRIVNRISKINFSLKFVPG